jgi:DNA polymerase III epsilon subunit-like protein
MKIVVFDTETTGLPSDKNASIYNSNKWPYIIQLSFMLYDTLNNEILIENDSIIKIPDNVKISDESEKIHGISLERSHNEGQDIIKVLENFDLCLNMADIVIGHNVLFDKKMIMVENIRNNRDSGFKDNKIAEYCTMKNGKEICKIYVESKYNKGDKYLKYPSLSELHEKLFNKIPSGLHNSWVDILVCLRCYYMLTNNKDLFKINKSFREKLNMYI